MLITETNLPTPGDRAPPNPASEPPAAPPPAAPADGTAALVAAVRDYVRPLLRDSGFPLAEAFARETRRRAAETDDAIRRAHQGYNELSDAMNATLRPALRTLESSLVIRFQEEMRRREAESALTAEELRRARKDLANARAAADDHAFMAKNSADAHSALIAAIRPALRPELRESPLAPADALLEEMRLRAAERDSLARELSEARDCLDALDQANQGLRKERDAAVAERVEQEALEALGESLIGEDFVEILEGGIRAELHDRHPDDLSARLAEEFALRDTERADLLEELRVAKADCENARRVAEGSSAVSRRNLDAFSALAAIIRPALRPELRESPRALDDALREEMRLRGEETAAATARIAALEASLADYERSNRALEQGLAAERVVMADMQRAAQRLEHAIVHQAISLYEADASARAFARSAVMRRAGAAEQG
jgi:hypothetical protein